ncbi:MAG: hypothetical protein FIA97_06265 [Methylococcaceae bacterium]|nr:hypothetical protein [Methylococcaceae bacterium]
MAGRTGLALLKLGLAAIILAILAVILLERLRYYQEAAEKLQVDTVLRSLDTALKLRMGEMAIANQAYRWGKLAGENPFDWLQPKPPDYCGVYDGDGPVARGCWRYDRLRREVIYRANLDGHLWIEGGASLLRFRLLVSAGEDGAATVAIRPAARYRWLEP